MADHNSTSSTPIADTGRRNAQVGTAVGAAGGITAGAIAGGVMGGPAGLVAGAALGAIAGGIGTRLLAEDFDTTPIDIHWRDRFDREPYYESGLGYDDYAPAYRLGAAARRRFPDASFEDTEAAMEAEYGDMRGESRLAWERAKNAARASFHTEYF